ncbi:MAG: LytTR family transcriptional regulator DNA-binding domain-containing protein [Cognatishimia sp.]|uniref:LytTR family DNA-binding domain-containing protein n=1 Tax=Cognatishimia sp. TaxID=2211648 RepID=UPI003B8DE9ED
MEDSPLQSAKREMQVNAQNKSVWVCLMAAGVILGIAGPFGTDQVLRAVPRLMYWFALTIGFYFVGSFVGTFLSRVFSSIGLPFWTAIVLAGAGAGIVIFIFLMGINIALFDVPLDCPSCVGILAANVIGIAIIITCSIVYLKELHPAEDEAKPAADLGEEPQPPAILRRLPFEKRGPLYSLSVSDHYVEITTAKGAVLVLMRLSDAIAETGAVSGLQVHRSHWVALAAVASAKRDGAKAILTLKDGREIPASRTYIPALKEAGVLPS